MIRAGSQMKWHLAETPPPLEIEEFNRMESIPVLAYLGNSVGAVMTVVKYSRYTDEEEGCWIDNGSEAWDVSGVITHWQFLPPTP
jgi:hypothetical protein